MGKTGLKSRDKIEEGEDRIEERRTGLKRLGLD